jgi:hypothetical protein
VARPHETLGPFKGVSVAEGISRRFDAIELDKK